MHGWHRNSVTRIWGVESFDWQWHYEKVAKSAMKSLFKQKSPLNLFGTHIDILTKQVEESKYSSF
jgi:hypothetical protein